MKEVENYAAKDQYKILDYLYKNGGQCTVEDLISHSGAERLRIYPMIFRLREMELLEIVERNSWGTPIMVKVV